MKRVLKWLGILAIALVAAGLAMYALGARVVMDGGGGLHVRFPESPESREQAVETHRKAQEDAGTAVVEPASPAGVSVGPAAPAALFAPAGPVAPAAADWSDFRGPDREGRYLGAPLLASWPVEGLKPLWKQPIGEGYAAFVVSAGRAVTIEQRGEREVVAAYDVRTGRQLWTNAWQARLREFMGGDGPRATPTIFEGIVHALGAEGELRALDVLTGRVVWRTNILEDAGANNVQWGMSGAPLIVDDTVVVHPGGPNGRSVIAYNRRTGTRVWSSLDDQAGYASPTLVTLAGTRQLLVFTASRLVGLKPENGELLWDHPWRTQADINAAQPLVVGPNRVFLSSGYGVGAAVLEIARDGNSFAVQEIWRNVRLKNRFNSSVLHNGFLYGFDESIMACVDAATGDLKWKGGRYGYGQLVLSGDRLIVLTEEGELVLVRASPERHDELARFAAISGKTWNHPAITNGILLIRNLREMAAFDLSVPGTSSRRTP